MLLCSQDGYGADVLRLWVSSIDYTGDVMIGAQVLRQMSDIYRKLRGTLRYLLGNLHDWHVCLTFPITNFRFNVFKSMVLFTVFKLPISTAWIKLFHTNIMTTILHYVSHFVVLLIYYYIMLAGWWCYFIPRSSHDWSACTISTWKFCKQQQRVLRKLSVL